MFIFLLKYLFKSCNLIPNLIFVSLEAPPTRYCSRRKSVFAETYNPEEDEEEEGPNVLK